MSIYQYTSKNVAVSFLYTIFTFNFVRFTYAGGASVPNKNNIRQNFIIILLRMVNFPFGAPI